MVRRVFIWRESIYHGDFRCNVCKKKLCEANGEPIDDALLVAVDAIHDPKYGAQDVLFCADCKNIVGKTFEADIESDEPLQGLWND